MGAVGSADTALAESFNATMKREVLQDAACWIDELTCRRQVFEWLVRYPPPSYLVRLPVPVHLRGPSGRYAADRSVITHRVQDPGGVGPQGLGSETSRPRIAWIADALRWLVGIVRFSV